MSYASKNTNTSSAKKNIRFDHQLIQDIEASKDPLIPFSAWVKAACQEKLAREQQCADTPHTVRTSVDLCALGNDNGVSANAKRQADAVANLAAICQSLTPLQKESIVNARYPKSEFAKAGAAIGKEAPRSTVAKYWDSVIQPRLLTP